MFYLNSNCALKAIIHFITVDEMKIAPPLMFTQLLKLKCKSDIRVFKVRFILINLMKAIIITFIA